jgi:uncharacterized membrane protein YfcA
MIDFMLSIFSSVLNMDMRDHHDIPFALPMVVAGVVGGSIGLTIVHFIGNDNNEDPEATVTNINNDS